MKIRPFRSLCFFPFLITFANLSFSQDTLSVKKELPFRITIGIGLGTGYPFQGDNGPTIGGNVEFAVKKNNTLFAIGARSMEEFDIFNNSNVSKTISSYDLTLGRILTKGKVFTGISTGLGIVRGLYPGKLISTERDSFIGHDIYEKDTYTIIGIPVSIKGILVPRRVYGVGLELYANFNSKNTFYGINLSQQIGRLNPEKSK